MGCDAGAKDAAPDAVDVACLLALALGATGVAYLIYFRLLAELGATSGMTVIFVVPVFGVLWAALFRGEAIHLSTVLGGAVILFSVFLITRETSAEHLQSRPQPVLGDWSNG